MSESHYVFIESRDPFEGSGTTFVPDTAAALSRRGKPVTIFLVQNGVLAARAAARGSQLPALARTGINVLADDFSLRERGIGESDITRGVKPAGIDVIVERLAASWKVLFL
jgi:intracellular sulfur oxidation DsrE/DsrF family protein